MVTNLIDKVVWSTTKYLFKASHGIELRGTIIVYYTFLNPIKHIHVLVDTLIDQYDECLYFQIKMDVREIVDRKGQKFSWGEADGYGWFIEMSKTRLNVHFGIIWIK